MKRSFLSSIFFAILLLNLISFLLPQHSYANPPDELDHGESYIRGLVLHVLNEHTQLIDKTKTYTETLQIKLLEGKENGKIVIIGFSGDGIFGTAQKVNTGDTVVVDSKPDPNGKRNYYIYEPYRLNTLLWIVIGFIILIVGVAGKKGIGGLLGLCISVVTIMAYIVPQIINGHDPLSVCITGAIIILICTTYLAHGVSVKTTVALISTAIALLAASLLSSMFVQSAHLLGLGNEDIYNLQVGTIHPINPQGLLLGSILIGTLGALNDITTTQAITIFTLVKENSKQKYFEVFQKGMIIGREHIASLINTLVLAYAGTSLAVFIFFALNPAQLPWWVILNNETTMLISYCRKCKL